MNHRDASRAFARRMGRGFWNRARKFSESAKPATGTGLASDGTTGADSGSDSRVGTDRLADARCSDESTKGTVARCVGSTDAPHVVTTAGAYAEQHQQRGAHEVTAIQRPYPPSTHSAGGGVCCMMLGAVPMHWDRWVTLGCAVLLLSFWVFAIIRAIRSSRPTTPPRGHSGVSKLTNNRR